MNKRKIDYKRKLKGEQIMIEPNVKKEQQQLHSLLPLGEGGRRPDEGADVTRSYTLETAKDAHESLRHPCKS